MKQEDVKEVSLETLRELYGNTAADLEGDVMAFEVSSRPQLEGLTWRPAFLIIAYCERGSARFRWADREVELGAGDLFIEVRLGIAEVLEVSPDFSAKIVAVGQQYAQECISAGPQLWPYLLFLFSESVFHLNVRERLWMNSAYATLVQRMKAKSHPYLRETTALVMRVLVYDVCALFRSRSAALPAISGRAYQLFDEFLHLVSEECKSHHDVAWYGARLCVTPKYLSEMVKSVSGRPAGFWINEILMMEAKSLLRESPLSVKEITLRLGFPNQSFFGTWFKKTAGLSPLSYRRRK